MVRVLVVDDSQTSRKILINYIGKMGFAVVAEAANGLEAIKKYRTAKPDITLLDIVMPGMDGLATLKKLREINSDAKVIMVSAMDDELSIKKAIQAGAKSFLAKPYDPQKLMAMLTHIRTELRHEAPAKSRGSVRKLKTQ
ncbi:MAG TPA: response regulator [Selenomonadales bacterium]|nr:response regulator [Selenomonadales bacterium]